LPEVNCIEDFFYTFGVPRMNTFRLLILLGTCTAIVFESSAFLPPEQDRLQNYDKRSAGVVPSNAASVTAASRLKSANAKAQVHFDPMPAYD
jgi:hypothetical protein